MLAHLKTDCQCQELDSWTWMSASICGSCHKYFSNTWLCEGSMSSVSVSTLTAFWGSVIYWIDSHCTTCTQLILVIDSQYEPACSQTAELLRGSFCTVLGGQFSWSALIKTFRWAISLEKHLREKVCEPAPVLGLLHNVPLLHHQLAPLAAQPGQELVSGNFLF